jgi:uncharacterized protein YbcV (DUF1398 family)
MKSWNEKELKAASEAMKKAGQMSFEEFCKAIEEQKKNNEAKETKNS